MRISLSNQWDVLRNVLNLQILGVAIILGLVAASFMLSVSVKKYMKSRDQIEESQTYNNTTKNRLEVAKKPLAGEKIIEIANTLKIMHPGVSIEPGADTLVLSGKTPDLYERWFLALMAAQHYGGKNLMWGAPSVCVGKCDKENALYAVIQPFQREVKTINN